MYCSANASPCQCFPSPEVHFLYRLAVDLICAMASAPEQCMTTSLTALRSSASGVRLLNFTPPRSDHQTVSVGILFPGFTFEHLAQFDHHFTDHAAGRGSSHNSHEGVARRDFNWNCPARGARSVHCVDGDHLSGCASSAAPVAMASSISSRLTAMLPECVRAPSRSATDPIFSSLTSSFITT